MGKSWLTPPSVKRRTFCTFLFVLFWGLLNSAVVLSKVHAITISHSSRTRIKVSNLHMHTMYGLKVGDKTYKHLFLRFLVTEYHNTALVVIPVDIQCQWTIRSIVLQVLKLPYQSRSKTLICAQEIPPFHV